MKMTSLWLDTQTLPRFAALKKSLVVDVVVVGAGITGVTAAYLFKKAGLRVALVERSRCGGVDTSYTTAHLTCVTDLRLHELVSRFGKDAARVTWEAGFAAIDQIVANIEADDIACNFKWVPGYLFAGPDSDPGEHKALAKDAKLAGELGFSVESLAAVPHFGSAGVKFNHQAQFHPLKYLRALLKKILGRGSHVFEYTEVTGVTDQPLQVEANGHKISCRYVVLATHTPLMGKANLLAATLFQTKLSLYTSYALGVRLPRNEIPDALFWDTALPYHYLRLDRQRGADYALFGGEDHKTGQETDTERPYRRLQSTLAKWIPKAVVDYRWSGQVIESNDGLPFIGETAERQFAATAFAGNGLTFGTLSAVMAVDAFFQRQNPWTELFSPHRKKIRGGTWRFLKENKDYPYYLLRNWMAQSEGSSIRALRRGQGKILNLEGKKVAAYRDDAGKVTVCSPICTHLKCIVAWNRAERTWDCPCHGSRFMATGEVMSGPAEKNLERIESGDD
jgi:glycine/D-amino acid oxidase-like deaminating enzyme/nitrite reductase/ring-hydroxylating ferredoxin subunit